MTDSTRIVIWEAESQNKVLADQVREGLRDVVDPEIGLNIIELGLVRDLRFESDHAWLKMILTTPFCPYGPAILEQTRNKASSVTGIPTKIEMGTEIWDPSMMEEGTGADWGLF